MYKRYFRERLSDVLFHATKSKNLISILKKNQFILGLSIRADESSYPYYLSFARSKLGDYSKNKDVIIEVDGNKLNQKYKGSPISYFNDREYSNEMEDRLFNNKRILPNAHKYITRINIDHSKVSDKDINIINSYSKKINIPLFIYENGNDMRTNKKPMDYKTFIDMDNDIENPDVDLDMKSIEKEINSLKEYNLFGILAYFLINNKFPPVDKIKNHYSFNNTYRNDLIEEIKNDFFYYNTYDPKSLSYRIAMYILSHIKKSKARNLTDLISKTIDRIIKYKTEIDNQKIVNKKLSKDDSAELIPKRDSRPKANVVNKERLEQEFLKATGMFLDEIPDEIEWKGNKLVFLKDTENTRWIKNYLEKN